MRAHIRMLDAPRTGFAAFMPTPYGATTPASSSSGITQSQIRGYPSLQTPSPAPVALNDGELGGPYNQPSRCAPDYFRPSVYFVKISQSLSMPGFKRTSNNKAPAKAPWIARTGTQTQMRTRVGGRTVTSWPRQFISWPTYRQVAAANGSGS
jgi:hypothetical protein